MGPHYPNYASQRFGGTLPSMREVGPSDLRYSSSTAPFYQNEIDRAHGRHLAGVDEEVQDEAAQPAYASNELAVYAELDDVQGNGVFDPPGTRPNIYSDSGILSARADIPGYLARERMYSPSEIIDVTTGRPVVYVPSGAVSMDSAAQIAFLERGAYAPPQPVLNAQSAQRMRTQSIVNVRQNPQAINGYGANESTQTGSGGSMSKMSVVGLLALAGLAAGAAYAAFKPRQRRNGRKRS